MIKPASRLDDIKEYYFASKLREIAELRAKGVDVISLGVGGPDLPPPAETTATMIREVSDPANHGYQPHAGIPELRRAFADWYQRRYGVSLDPSSEILPLIGSKEAVTHISLAFLNPGDRALIPDPGYPTYSSITRLVGGVPLYYPLSEDNGWQPDFDLLEASDLSGVKIMWMNYPHMPTGARAKRQTFERAVDFARRHGILLVHDNPYSLILNPEPMSLLEVEGAREVAVELNSLSKSHNMPGWRVGVAISNPTFISWILKVKSNVDSGQFRPLMLAAAKALGQPDEWQDELNAHYAGRRRIAEEIMEALGCSFDPSQSGLFLWGRLRDDSIDAGQLVDRVLAEARVFITPGFIFGSRGRRYIRLSLCAPEERLREALARINNLTSDTEHQLSSK